MTRKLELIKEWNDWLAVEELREIQKNLDVIVKKAIDLYEYMNDEMNDVLSKSLGSAIDSLQTNRNFISEWSGQGIGDYESVDDMKKVNDSILHYKLLKGLDLDNITRHSKMNVVEHLMDNIMDEFDQATLNGRILTNYRLLEGTNKYRPSYMICIDVSIDTTEKEFESFINEHIEEFESYNLTIHEKLFVPQELDSKVITLVTLIENDN